MAPTRATLVRERPVDPAKSHMENVLELVALIDMGPDIFTNARQLWRPKGARGIFGGAVIAQCLSAAQRTVPMDFTVHSMHCYFVLAGDSEIPVIYYVERVREGKSFATRTVQARQRGKCIFTTTLSFMKEHSGGAQVIEHARPMPKVEGPFEDQPGNPDGPFQGHQIAILNADSSDPHVKKTRQWVRATGRISAEGGHQAHLNALAYMSDSYFIGTVARIHGLVKANDRSSDSQPAKKPEMAEPKDDREVGMMVSLDHTIYFHNPRNFRADDWLLTEMESPWSGDGRGVATQEIYTRDGLLVATCVQEASDATQGQVPRLTHHRA